MECDLAISDKQTMPIVTPNSASSSAIVSWTVHLAREYPAKAIVSIAFILAASTAGFFAVGLAAAALVGVVLVASFSDFLFPVRYAITSDRVTCKMLMKSSEIKWVDVKRCYLDGSGVKLSPLDRVSRLEAFRGVYLRYADNESEVIEIVKSLRPSDV